MQFRILATSALAIAAGCASQQKAETVAAPEFAPAPAKAAPAEKPKLQMGASDSMLASTCAGCHGTNGNSHGPAAPTIAGLEADYLLETMQAYKTGERHGTIMGRIVKGYTDEELEQIANFYADNTYVGWTQAYLGPKANMGQKLHDNYCEKCHEDEATVYRLNEAGSKITKVSGGLTAGDAGADTLKREAAYAHSWFTNITSDIFG